MCPITLSEQVINLDPSFNTRELQSSKENLKIMPELNPQPLPPRIELGEAIEVITAATLRAIEAQKAYPVPNPWLTTSNIRIIAGGILDVQGSLTRVEGIEQ